MGLGDEMKAGWKDAVVRIREDLWNHKEIILIFTVYYMIVHAVFHAFCPVVIITGFPCAGCGMTRAVFYLCTGRFVRSWQLNPMAFPVIMFIGYCMVCRYFLGKKIKGFKTGLVILGLGMLTAYIYRMYTVFPNRPPYTYTSGNFLEKSFPVLYSRILKALGIL